MNSKRGFVDVEIGNESYRMRLNMNAIAEIEDHFGGKSLIELFSGGESFIKSLKAKDFVTLFHSALVHGGSTELTKEKVGDLVDFKNLEYLISKFMECVQESSPKVSTKKNNTEQKQNPQILKTVSIGTD